MSHNPETVYDREHMDECLQDALESINPEYRMAVVLCDIEGFSYEEIAQMMGTSIGTVRSRIHRGADGRSGSESLPALRSGRRR